ncbi:MAG: hypothetical protein DDT19_02102 [Syntrophomonadaceae bacterium]|nr:hypothetical protein [Bacillota bacterium]
MLNSVMGAGLISRPLTIEEMGVIMMKIKVLRGCGANGKSLEAGRIYSVPDEVSAEDANILLLMNLAKEVQSKMDEVQTETTQVETEKVQTEAIQETQIEVAQGIRQEIQEEKKLRRGRPRRRRE